MLGEFFEEGLAVVEGELVYGAELIEVDEDSYCGEDGEDGDQEPLLMGPDAEEEEAGGNAC